MKAIGTVYLEGAVVPLGYYRKEIKGLVLTYYLLDGRTINRVLPDVYE